MSFKAYRIDNRENQIVPEFQQMKLDQLTPGEVVVRVSWSGINYKDALAATGKGKILRTFPLNGGIDLAGVVVSSEDERFREGERVAVCGCGLSETRDGGYAEFARVGADCVVHLPARLSEREAMAIGTAGFTAALAVMRMEQNGQHPELGPILVTGATGGVGSIAIDLLAGLGYKVVAFTGKQEQYDYLRSLGASDFVDRHSIEMGTRPLEKGLWGGAVDSAGGETLGWLTRTVKPWGSIASIGLAGGHELHTTVMPFILRGVALLGINSIEMPASLRAEVWSRLADDLKPKRLDTVVTREIDFDELPDAFDLFLNAKVTGRTVVRIGG